MGDVKYDYNPEENYNLDPEEDYNSEREEIQATKKTLRGYRVIVILLTIILVGVSVLYINLDKKQKQNYKELQRFHGESEAMRNDLEIELNALMEGYDTLRTNTDSLNVQYENAQKMIEQLKNERRLNYNAMAKYKKEIETMRGVMKSYLKQIDALNKENEKLSGENIELKKKNAQETLRADKAEEQAKEAKNIIKQGSVLRARDITLTALNAKGNEVSRIKNSKKLRVDFVVGANNIAAAGNRNVYLCLISPDGYLLSTDAMPAFDYQGSSKSYSAAREIDYQNEDVDVAIYYDGSGFIPGKYQIELYMDDTLIGSTEVAMR